MIKIKKWEIIFKNEKNTLIPCEITTIHLNDTLAKVRHIPISYLRTLQYKIPHSLLKLSVMRKSVLLIIFSCFNIALFAQWETPVIVNSDALFFSYQKLDITEVNGAPAMCYLSDCNVLLGPPKLMFIRANDANGTSWGTPIEIDSIPTNSYASIAMVDGHPAIAYTKDSSIKYIRADDPNGTSWTNFYSVPYNFSKYDIQLNIIKGNPFISLSAAGSSLRYLRALDSTGSTWSGLGTIDGGINNNVGRYHSMAMANQEPASTYYDATNTALKYIRASDTSTPTWFWETPIIIDNNSNTGLYTSLNIVNQNPAVSYFDSTDEDLKYVRANDLNGTSWGTPVTVDAVGNVGKNSTLTIIDGKPAIFYHDETNGNLMFVRANDIDGTSWGHPHAIDIGGISISYSVVNGHPSVAHIDNEDFKFIRSSMPVPSHYIYVDANSTGNNTGSSWTDPFTDLQDALALGANAEIFVAEGTYKPTATANRGIAFQISSNVSIKGGYSSGGGDRNPELYPTILSGDINNDGLPKGNSLHVVKATNVNNVSLDGLTIQDGNANKPGFYSKERGGGVYINNSTVNIHNCIIVENKAIYGGGLFAANAQDVSINHSLITDNEAQYGCAVYHVANSSVYIRNSRIIDNRSTKRCAIEAQNSTHTLIENSVVANNFSNWANALAFITVNSSQTCEIRNSTILGHNDDDDLITIKVGANRQLDMDIDNSIIAHQDINHSKAFRINNSGTLNMNTENCYIQGNTVHGNAVNNLYSDIDGDLLLESDYSVDLCSPVVDAGNDALATGINYDLAGNPRLYNTIDIGAYEGQSVTNCNGGGGVSKLIVETYDYKLFPNPARNHINIDFNINQRTTINIKIIDLLGRVVHSQSNDYGLGLQIENIDIGHLEKGNYFLSVYNGTEMRTIKFSKL